MDLPPFHRKLICGRILWFDTFEWRHSDYTSLDSESAFVRLRSHVEERTDRELLENDKADFQEFVNGFVKGMAHRIATESQSAESPFAQGLGELKQKASNLDYNIWSDSDRRLQSPCACDVRCLCDPDRAFEPIRALFDLAREAAFEYYNHYVESFPQVTPHVAIRLVCTPREEPHHDFPNSFYVSGLTEFGEHDNTPLSTIHLRVDADRFTFETYLACLYVLFHEFFCHAFQLIGPDPAHRGSTGPYDGYAEGWMDWAACQALRDVVCFEDGPANIPLDKLDPYAHQQLRVADKFHESRCSLKGDRKQRARSSASNREGAEAAQLAFGILARNLDDFFRLSFWLNTHSEFRLPERQLFVRQIRAAPEEKLRPALHNVLVNKDLKQFLAEIAQAAQTVSRVF